MQAEDRLKIMANNVRVTTWTASHLLNAMQAVCVGVFLEHQQAARHRQQRRNRRLATRATCMTITCTASTLSLRPCHTQPVLRIRPEASSTARVCRCSLCCVVCCHTCAAVLRLLCYCAHLSPACAKTAALLVTQGTGSARLGDRGARPHEAVCVCVGGCSWDGARKKGGFAGRSSSSSSRVCMQTWQICSRTENSHRKMMHACSKIESHPP